MVLFEVLQAKRPPVKGVSECWNLAENDHNFNRNILLFQSKASEIKSSKVETEVDTSLSLEIEHSIGRGKGIVCSGSVTVIMTLTLCVTAGNEFYSR